MVTDKMKLAFFCILHVACVGAGYSTRNDLQAARGILLGGRFQAPQSTGECMGCPAVRTFCTATNRSLFLLLLFDYIQIKQIILSQT